MTSKWLLLDKACSSSCSAFVALHMRLMSCLLSTCKPTLHVQWLDICTCSGAPVTLDLSMTVWCCVEYSSVVIHEGHAVYECGKGHMQPWSVGLTMPWGHANCPLPGP